MAEAVADRTNELWPDDISLLGSGALDWSLAMGYWQVTDVYLLALVVRHGGRLASRTANFR